MYRVFRRFEKLAFGIVTASALACAAFIVVERCGGVSVQSLANALVANAAADNALACEQARQMAWCEQPRVVWRGVK
ncbi:hypothetical protein [Paraburkholderia tagetis]|uniref:Uncharacterized protein n=1 Tax=Paraburkholderia tagetis TaxID=2913261 RepID=A0A9X2A1L3_9BURK|nr:hypothetical protein [Paraburkholderia tagetis]MCG5078740.1 hypothetical protein [Paraburkholderia tagetis]